jgi:metallophosphoesterase (TIGR03767 family)
MKSWQNVSDTRNQRIIRGQANELGWVELEIAPGEQLDGQAPSPGSHSLLTFIHISDLHICDAQSPARVELMDRFADPHHPMSALVPFVGAYRAQEILTTQTLESMVRTVNSIKHGVHSDRAVDFVIATGDVTDNAQANELDWYFTLMEGGQILPDSGDYDLWEGVAQQDPEKYDRSYWNPEGTPAGCEDDYPRSLYGFPTVPGLTAAVRQSFIATGLVHKWYATHGNHDALLQGTVPPNAELIEITTGANRLTSLAPDLDLTKVFGGWSMVGPAGYVSPQGGTFRDQKADPRRRFNEASDWAKLHLACKDDGHADHDGHGLTEKNAIDGTKYWFRDHEEFRLISLDTVNINGGWQGSINETQFNWLKSLLNQSSGKRVILFSHHPLHSLFNDYAPAGAERQVAREEIEEELLHHREIIAWFAGHDHDNRIHYIGTEGVNGFWHVLTASLIDWPQQGRIVEILLDGTDLVIATSVIDHDSPVDLPTALSTLDNPVNLAGLSRILSANHWQRRKKNDFFNELAAGEAVDRNRFLRLGVR